MSKMQAASVGLLTVSLILGITVIFLGWWSLSTNLGGEQETDIKPFERGSGLDEETLITGLLVVTANVLLLAAIVLELAPVIGRRIGLGFPAAAIVLAIGFGACAILYTMDAWPEKGARIDDEQVGFNDRVSKSTMFGTYWLDAHPGTGWYLAFAAFGVPTTALSLQFARARLPVNPKTPIMILTANDPLIAIKRPKGSEGNVTLRSR